MTLDPEDDFLVTMSDSRPMFCPPGQRRWFNDHGFDFQDYLDNGIMASVLLATGDAYAIRIVTALMERRNGDG